MELLEAWRRGVREFNRGRYWHAHEEWERGWTRLPEDRKRHIQGLIMACGVFYLLAKDDPRRLRGAASLCVLARAKLARDEQDRDRRKSWPAWIEIHGLRAELTRIHRVLSRHPQDRPLSPRFQWKSRCRRLRARLLVTARRS